MAASVNQFKLWFYSQPRAIRTLLSINVVVYLIWQLVFIHFESTQVFFLRHLALNPGLQSVLVEPWQLLTYAFLHLDPGLGGLLHILFNMMWMMWIGREYETIYGPGKLIGMYVLGAVGGAFLTVLLHYIFPTVAVFGGIVHGASGAVLAIMTMVAIHQPEQRIGLMFIGVVRLIHVVIGFLALDILFLSAGGTAVSAHWGGVIAGFIGGQMILRGINPTGWADWLFRMDRRRESTSTGRGRFAAGGRSGPRANLRVDGSSDPSEGSFLHRVEGWLANRKTQSLGQDKPPKAAIYRMDVSARHVEESEDSNIDRILDKISASGYDSLSRKEKEILLKESGDKK